MSWITLSSADVLARLTTDELTAFEAVGETASTDKLAAIMAQVTGLVRSKVASCQRNTVGAAGKIPADCVFHAVSLCRSAIVASQPTMEGVSDPRKEEALAAHKYFDQVAKCEIAIADEGGTYPWAATASSDSYGGDDLLQF